MRNEKITNVNIAKKNNDFVEFGKFEELMTVDKVNIDFGHCLPKFQKHDKFMVTNIHDTDLLMVWNEGENFCSIWYL